MNNDNILEQLSQEEIQSILQLAQTLHRDGNEKVEMPNLILDNLNNTTTKDQQRTNNRFVRQLRNYDGDQWTKAGATNKELLVELKKANVDANQHVQQVYKDAERIRNTARAATELYDDINTIINSDNIEELKSQLGNLQQKCAMLAFYGYSTSKQLDNEAKKITTSAIRLPNSMRFVAETEDEDKDLVFTPEEMERLFDDRYKEQMLRQATGRRGHGQQFSKQRGNRQSYYQQRPQQYQQKTFFGKPRHQQQQQSQPQYKSGNQTQQPNQEQSN
jgi:hypothetical protein